MKTPELPPRLPMWLWIVVLMVAIGCAVKENPMFGDAEGLEQMVGTDSNKTEAPGGVSAAGSLVPGEHKEVSVQQDFRREGTFVVQVSLQRPNPQAPSVTVVSAEVLVTFSLKGNSTTRRISAGPGVSIAGNAEHVSVRVIDTSAPAVFPDVVDETYRVRILVSRGTRASIDQPPTLIQGVAQTQLAGGAATSFAVPLDAGAISLHVDVSALAGAPLPDNGVQVDQLSDAAATFILKSYDPRTDTWVPLAPGCTFVRIRNRTAAQIILVRGTFGVDG